MSSSSSECGEKERASVNSGGLNTKGKATAASLLTTDKVIVSKGDKDAAKVHLNVLCSSSKEQKDNNNHTTDKKTAVQRKSTSSCDGETVEERKSSSSTEGTSNSPVQSDTDVKITVTVDTSPDPFSSDQTNKALELEKEAPSTVDQCKKTTSTNKVVTDKKEPPKPSKSSWADLFKNSAKPSPGIVIKTASSVLRTETHSASGLKKTEDPVQTTVGVEEDKYAKKFAGNEYVCQSRKKLGQSKLQVWGFDQGHQLCYVLGQDT